MRGFLPACLSACLPGCLPACLSTCLPAGRPLAARPPACPSACLIISCLCPSVRLAFPLFSCEQTAAIFGNNSSTDGRGWIMENLVKVSADVCVISQASRYPARPSGTRPGQPGQPVPGQASRYPARPAGTRPGHPVPDQASRYPARPAGTRPDHPVPGQASRYPCNLSVGSVISGPAPSRDAHQLLLQLSSCSASSSILRRWSGKLCAERV